MEGGDYGREEERGGGGEERDGGILKGKHKPDRQLCTRCLFSQSCWVAVKTWRRRESCGWREDGREARFIKVLLDEWASREKRDGMEGRDGVKENEHDWDIEGEKQGSREGRMKGGRERKTRNGD